MSTLAKHQLIQKQGNPPFYTLTLKGTQIAKEIHSEHLERSKSSVIQPMSLPEHSLQSFKAEPEENNITKKKIQEKNIQEKKTQEKKIQEKKTQENNMQEKKTQNTEKKKQDECSDEDVIFVGASNNGFQGRCAMKRSKLELSIPRDLYQAIPSLLQSKQYELILLLDKREQRGKIKFKFRNLFFLNQRFKTQNSKNQILKDKISLLKKGTYQSEM